MERNGVEISCSGCGESTKKVGPLGTCRSCGGVLTADYDIDELQGSQRKALFQGNGVWRYSRLLPISPKEMPVSLGEGGTTLLRSQRLGEILGMGKLFLKNETTNPTGSFVDRGTTVEMTYARDSGYTSVSSAYSGNLAASVAAYSARAGLSAEAFLPSDVDIGKLYQVVAYGARIVQVKDQDEAEQMMMKLPDDCHRITTESPFFLEGIKTTGLEIAEQMEWHVPDRIILSIGSGAHMAMLWKAMRELERLGLVDASKTKLTGVQMKGCAPLVEAMGKAKRSTGRDKGVSLAREIAVYHPHMLDKAVQAIKESDGTAIAVDERDIIDAVQLLARAEGIFAEPAAAASIAGLRNLLEDGEIDRGERVVCIITGTGLKEPVASQKTMRRFSGARKIAMRMEKRIKMLDLGSTKEAVLSLMGQKADYGYGIWKRLKEEKGIEISLVSVYQHLTELEAAEMIKRDRTETSPKRRTRVLYSLTPRGERFLIENRDGSRKN
jgi:threonine synthase